MTSTTTHTSAPNSSAPASSKPTSPSQIPSRSNILSSLHENGYVIIPQLLPPANPLFPLLLRASQNLVSAALAGKWPHIRTLPKQFPPWPSTPESGIWGVQHLLHPDLPLTHEEKKALASGYFSPKILGVVRELLGVTNEEGGKEQLGMELFNLLCQPQLPPSTFTSTSPSSSPSPSSPPSSAENAPQSPSSPPPQGLDFSLRWHRDDIPPHITGPAEETALHLHPDHGRKHYTHTQYNLPLTPDTSLLVVPGSHRRARTSAELAATPYSAAMPGQIVVDLQPGDVVFYDNNILHRGVYSGERERLVLHGSVGLKGKGGSRARNVLQHGVGEWVGRVDFGEGGLGLEGEVRGRAERMRDVLLEMGRVVDGRGGVGFSQAD